MKRQLSLLALVIAVALLASGIGGAIGTSAGFQAGSQQPAGLSASPLVPVGSGLGYQGQLIQGGVPANGLYDFTFYLYDALSGGNLVGGPINLLNQQVTNGLFNVSLDFGPDAFLGDARWLELAVRVAGGGTYTTLTPRQPLSAVPYAQSAPWRGVSNKPWGYSVKRVPNIPTTVDSAGFVGDYTSATIGGDELGLISYYDITNGDLKVAHCNDADCSSSTTTTLDGATGNAGYFTSITTGVDGLGLISYGYEGVGLKVAHCDNAACTSATISLIDSNYFYFRGYNSITIGVDGLGVMSYYDYNNGNLKTAHCLNLACTSSTNTTLYSFNDVGWYNSITIGSDGRGLISMVDNTRRNLMVVHCFNIECSSIASAYDIDNTVDVRDTSVTTGADGLGLISYYDDTNGALRVAHCANDFCSYASNATLIDNDFYNVVGINNSITTGANGFGLISYYNYTAGDLRLAACNNLACTSATITTLDSAGDVGARPSVTVGADGLPFISYQRYQGGDLMALRCGSPFCTAYQHGRR